MLVDTLTITNEYNESELLRRLKGGDAKAMSAIYDTYSRGLLNSAFNVLRERSVSEDILQEVFLSLWMQRERLNIVTSLKSYLYSAVRYQVFKAIRQGKGTEALFDHIEERIWGEPAQEHLLFQKELQARIARIVETLPDKCREIYLLSREEQLSHKEIAGRLNITTKAVEFQITAALKRIRQSLPDLLPFVAAWLCQNIFD